MPTEGRELRNISTYGDLCTSGKEDRVGVKLRRGSRKKKGKLLRYQF